MAYQVLSNVHPSDQVRGMLGREIAVHRMSDGAVLMMRLHDEERGTLMIAYTDRGFFAGDRRAFHRLVFRIGRDILEAEIATADQLVATHYRPHLVRDFFAGRPLPSAVEPR